MKLRIYTLVILLAVTMTSSAELITLRGKVTDERTGDVIPGASVLSGYYGTSADGKGNFVFYVQQSVIEHNGITVSCIGYQTVHATIIADNFNFRLTPIVHELKAVDISVDAETIVQKAYRKITDNYSSRSMNIIGIEKMINSIRDTVGYRYFYTNLAEIKIYKPSYGNTLSKGQVGLLQKDENMTGNPHIDNVRFVDGYKLILDYDCVHNRAIMLKGTNEAYVYKLNRKEEINGRRTYVVNFYSQTSESNAGILYIDSATSAFVKVLYTKYNVHSTIPNYIDLDKITWSVEFRNQDDKWVLNAVNFNSITNHQGYIHERSDEFKSAKFDSVNANPLPANASILVDMADPSIEPYNGFTAADRQLPKDIQKAIESSFSKVQMPKVVDRQ